MRVGIRRSKMKINPRKYYLTILIASLIWIFLGKSYYNNFAPLLFFTLGFPVFMYLYFSNLSSFSKKLKDRNPKLFHTNAVHYGYFKGEMIHGMNLFNSPEFDTLDDDDLKSSYLNSKSSLYYILISFISFLIIAIMTIYIQ